MTLPAGTRLGPYEITAPIGAGGMGEVYRATDTTLGRDVAVKVLPEEFGNDPARLARFEREAKILASLNHPHIAQIYGLETSAGIHALVMELVEGPTLADRIAQGALPIDEALPIARQIAEALEAAHEKGVVHRDLKPANVKVRPDGMVKVLDFGLAKPNDPGISSDPDHWSKLPTMATAATTQAGMILGTVAYMAPEQARGKEVDRRADIWAFGCVLYEALTGKRAFEGEDLSDTLATVLKSDPDWEALPADVPPAIRNLLRRCLEKDRQERLADIAVVLFLLDEVRRAPRKGSAEGAWSQGPDQASVQQRTEEAGAAVRQALARSARRRLVMASAAAVIAGAVVAGVITWYATRPAAPRVTRLTITPPAGAALTVNGIDRDLAITPDGSRIVYAGNNNSQLFVRALDSLEPVTIFSGDARGPFVSPDGQWIGFADGDTSLKKVAITGGPAVTLAPLDGGSRGATWTSDGTVIFATNAATGLQRVSDTGGTPEVLTRPDRATGELDHLWPEILPGGRGVLFTTTAQTGGLNAAQVTVLDLQSGERKMLVRGGSHAHYLSSGHLVYAAAGTLRAIAFDLDRLETRGASVLVVNQVVTTSPGGVDAVVAADGTLAYVTGPGGDMGVPRTPVWVDRQGQESPIAAPPRSYLYPRISPDGASVVLFSPDQENDIWRWDFARATLTRLTFEATVDSSPVWTPDGRRLIFSSERAGPRNLFWQTSDGTGAVERLTESPNQQNPVAVSSDGTRLFFTEVAPKTGADVMQLQLEAAPSAGPGPVEPRRITPILQTPFAEQNGILSPDGNWLAYEANDSGRFEVYVRPFPDVRGGHWQVSTGGGARPLWAPGGEELFYVSPSGAIMRVGVERGPSWAATAPSLLIKEGYVTAPAGSPGRTYDISPDGERFLLIKTASGSELGAAPNNLIVVQHFDEELERLVPAN